MHTSKHRAHGGEVDAKSAALPSTKKLLCWYCAEPGHTKVECPVFKKVSEMKVEARGLVESATATLSKPSEPEETDVDYRGLMYIDQGCSEGYSGQQKKKERVSSLHPFELAMDSGCSLTA
jgi:hypothetical protein